MGFSSIKINQDGSHKTLCFGQMVGFIIPKYMVVDFGPESIESSRQTLVSPIFRSGLVPSVAACFRKCGPG